MPRIKWNSDLPFDERFWEKVDIKSIDECWPWKAALDGKGYGQIRSKGKQLISSRIAWELTNGPIPEGMLILHKCDNRTCCNPNHLYIGTHSDNMQDRENRNRAPNAGRPPSIPNEIIKTIKQLYKEGNSQMSMSRQFGISQPYISYILHGKARVKSV